LKNVLILGSEGQIGKGLAKYLSEKNFAVEGIDIKNNIFEDLRINENSVIKEAIAKAEMVIFLAFDVGGSKYLESHQNSYAFIQNNLQIMVNTFKELQLMQKNFIFASSQMAGMSHSTYGVLKLIGEKLTTALGGRALRFWNVYGLEVEIEKSHVITDFINQAANLGKITMLTNGIEKRDFLHVEDCSRAIETIMNDYDSSTLPRLLDVASFKYTSILDLANLIAAKFKAKVEVNELIDNVQQGHSFDPSPEILKFWQPRISLDEGIMQVTRDLGFE
jgi:nucleoside-diphosphate-sugar epimerase